MPFLVLLLTLVLSTPAFAGKLTPNKFTATVDEYVSGAPIVVPPGNRNNAQKAYEEGKYQNIRNLITQKENICVIKDAAAIYNVDPMAIMGSIIGEHTYNVDAWDVGQENYLYMVKKWVTRFNSEGVDLIDMLQEDKYAACEGAATNFDLWECYNSVWKTDKRNSRRNKTNWELKWTFFNPMGAGHTYGFGQFGPERALMVTDMVHQYSGFPEVSLDNVEELYNTILNPQTSIHYVAATNRISIDTYLKVANFDISKNPGIIATLYNLGREAEKAANLREKTIENLEAKGSSTYPEVNSYGWFINSKQEELSAAYEKAVARHCP